MLDYPANCIYMVCITDGTSGGKYILHILNTYIYIYKDGKILHLIQQSEISPIIFLVLSYLSHMFFNLWKEIMWVEFLSFSF